MALRIDRASCWPPALAMEPTLDQIASSTRATERLTSLFQYLAELSKVRSPPARKLSDHPRHIHLDRFPNHSSVEQHIADEPEVVVRVRRPNPLPCPTPPKALAPFIPQGWDDIEVATVELDKDLDQDDLLDAIEDVDTIFAEWAERRNRWRAAQLPCHRAHAVFLELRGLHRLLERESERYRLLLADGNLALPGGDCHPLLYWPLELSFDPKTDTFTLERLDKPARLFTDLLRQLDGVDAHDIGTSIDSIENTPPEPGPAVALFLADLARTLFAEPDILTAAPLTSPLKPTVFPRPVVILAKKNLGYAEALTRFADNPERREPVSDALLGILGLIPEVMSRSTNTGERASPRPDERPLFVLPANQSQTEALHRLTRTGQVLIQGPPGTGKTHTIANLIGHLLAQGKTVLVTSHTSKALEVVRDKLPPQLQDLCVTLLDSDVESQRQLGSSVQGIVGHLSNDSTSELSQRVERITAQHNTATQDLAQQERKLLTLLRREHETLTLGERTWTPIQAAQHLHENSDNDWIPGSILGPVPISQEDLASLRQSAPLAEAHNLAALNAQRVDLTALPTPQQLHDLDLAIEQLRPSAAGMRPELFCAQPPHPNTAHLPSAYLNTASTVPTELSIFVETGVQGDLIAQTDLELIAKTESVVPLVDAQLRAHIQHRIELGDQPADEGFLQTIAEMLAHADAGGSFGWFQTLTHPQWRTILGACTVDDTSPTTVGKLQALHDHGAAQQALDALASRWAHQIQGRGGPALPSTSQGTAPLLRLVDAARRAIDVGKTLRQGIAGLSQHGLVVDALFAALPSGSDPQGPLAQAVDVLQLAQAQLDAKAARERITSQRNTRNQLIARIRTLAPDAPNPVFANIVQQATTGDWDGYTASIEALQEAEVVRATLVHRSELLCRLQRQAPLLANHIANDQWHAASAQVPLHEAWELASLRCWLDSLNEDPGAVQAAVSHQRQLIRTLTQDLVEARAWYHQLQRTNRKQQQALVGWVDTIKKIGKGSGKRAPALQRMAQQQQAECRTAVPVWVMPLYRVIESYDLATTRFDVVILDEASQSDVMALPALGLGKDMVVVGDHEQVSPSAVGEKSEQVDLLIAQFLRGIPNAHLYDGKTSVYDLARQSFGGLVQLVEHFRCVPSIIGFSNRLCYDGRIQPLREPGSATLRPAVLDVYVADGERAQGRRRSTKTNPREAQRIASLVVAATRDPAYAGRTLGVISLLGNEQAELIDQLIDERLNPETRHAFRLRCGGAAHFQGDERDVIFLSMVDSPKSNGPLRLSSQPATRQRYNVAASRARDQLWVVHSLRPEVDLKPDDLRKQLLVYARDPELSRTGLADKLDAADSVFEQRVMRDLVERGFEVHPQWPVGGYRIDIVVQAGDRRMAIECDGERFHGPDQLQADLARQALLERLGWRFIRIRGSRYFRDPRGAMDDVEAKLREAGLLPGTSVLPPPPSTATPLQEHAARLRIEWGWDQLDGTEAEPPPAPAAPARRASTQPTVPAPLATQPVSAPAQPADPPQQQQQAKSPAVVQSGRPPIRAAAARPAKPPPRRERSVPPSDAPRAVQAMLPLFAPTAPPTGAAASRPAKPPPRRARSAPRSGAPQVVKPSRPPRPPADPVIAAIAASSPEWNPPQCPECAAESPCWVGKKGPFSKCPNEGCGCRFSPPADVLDQALQHLNMDCAACGGQLKPQTVRSGSHLHCAECGVNEPWKALRDRVASRPQDR